MKKTMLAILMLIISCAATNLYAETTYQPTIYTKNNKFYSSKPYCYSEWEYHHLSKLSFQFLYTTEDNKTYFKIRRIINSKVLISSDDYIIIIFKDGKEYRLDYCTELFYNGQYSYIEAMGEINDFTDLTEIIYIQNGYYYAGYDSIKTSSTYLLESYNGLMLEAEKLKE